MPPLIGHAGPVTSVNFGFLREPPLGRLGAQAERDAASDPVASLLASRQLADALLQAATARLGIVTGPHGNPLALLRVLEDEGVLSGELVEVFHGIRRSDDAAAQRTTATPATLADAVAVLRLVRAAAVWYQQAFADPGFSPGPFVAPTPAAGTMADRQADTALEQAGGRQDVVVESTTPPHMPGPASDADRAALRARARAAAGALALDEAATRRLIDQQLRDAGWEADNATLTHAAGARPQRGRHQAIAEWPTATGPADYVLFSGLTAVGVVEAKRHATDVRSALGQAARYARGFAAMDGALVPHGAPWGHAPEGPAHVPFHFATNGRPFLRQLLERSGIWFRDARRTTNHARALEGWYTPQGLLDLLAQDVARADATLAATPSDYLPLRDYQHAAIRAAEAAIVRGQREILLAMATGTGKTRTLLGLVYRLIKAGRFRRVLFLVDRTALGEQALEAFETVRLEGLQRFVDVYDVKALGDLRPDRDTRLHLATVQGMVRRLLLPGEGDVPLPADAYDCVVVDEAHRGYVLDRELGDAEVAHRESGIRSEADFLSKYRRVLDHFDAVKIALTATPALHTTEIFGAPVYTYSYRQAVVDGWLVDHEPPVRIVTALSQDGIRWRPGEQVPVYDTGRAQTELFTTPDELAFEVEDFNRKVVTEAFNRVVCGELAARIDPSLPGKTLVFAATDAHADLVVRLLTEAFEARFGPVEDDTVVKITAAADDPRQLIRRFRNERRPAVVVTVDLLTTGVDVPEIVNVVFLRRVRSRILYEQMLGRATRLRPDLHGPGEDKEAFRIYDAVDLYAALEPHTAMRPVVPSGTVSVATLVADLARAVAAGVDDAQRALHEQLVAALRRRRNRLRDATASVDAAAGVEASAAGTVGIGGLIERLRRATPAEAAAFLTARPALVELLDRHGLGGTRLLISTHADALRAVERGYGSDAAGARQRPEDYLDGFAAYLRAHLNEIPALLVVTQRPRELTRAQLRELRLALDAAGYPEAALRTAFRDVTNQDIAAGIVGYVRRQALGDPLVPYAERVARAVDRLLARQPWTDVQRKWLRRIGQQLEKELVVDREALDREQFREQGGGFDRLDRVFEGELAAVVGDLQDAVWQESA